MPKTEVEQVKTITIPEIKICRMRIQIVGITELIQNRFRDDSKRQIEDKQQGKAKMTKAARNPDEEFRGALHVIEDGVYGFPGIGIKKALVAAGGRFADETMTILRGVINIDADLVPIKGQPRMRSDFVMLNSGKGPGSIAYRPGFKEWSMEVPVSFMSNMATESQIVNLFQIAGFAIGIGAWRPEKNGTFGQFRIEGASA